MTAAQCGGFSHQPHDTRLFLFLNMVVISPQESTVGGGRGLMTTIFKTKETSVARLVRESTPRKFALCAACMCQELNTMAQLPGEATLRERLATC